MGFCTTVEKDRKADNQKQKARYQAKRQRTLVWEQMNTVVRLTVEQAPAAKIRAALARLKALTQQPRESQS